MDKRVKWGIIILIVVGLTGLGLYRFLPRKHDSQANEAPVATSSQQSRRVLNVDAVVVREQTLIDDYATKSRLMPDEEVDLSFQTSGLITNIYFTEGTYVKKRTTTGQG